MQQKAIKSHAKVVSYYNITPLNTCKNRPHQQAQQTFAVAEREEKPDEVEELGKEIAALKVKVDNPTMPVMKVADVCGLCHGQHPPTACPFMNGQVGPGEPE